MNRRSYLATLKQLIRDTFRQAWATGIFGMMLAVTAICTLLCLSVSVTADATLHSPDEPAYFLPPPSARALAPSVAAVLGSSQFLESLTLIGASQKTWFSLET